MCSALFDQIATIVELGIQRFFPINERKFKHTRKITKINQDTGSQKLALVINFHFSHRTITRKRHLTRMFCTNNKCRHVPMENN